MQKKSKGLTVFLATLMLAAALVAPQGVAARGPSSKAPARDMAIALIPRNLRSPIEVEALDVSVTIYPGSMPRGGIVILLVSRSRSGEVVADFLPDQTFSKPVLIDFGEADVVVWESARGDVLIPTADVDHDGDGGEFYTDHFSRYSGFF